MTLHTDEKQNIIERHVHCPYCNSEEAMLLSQLAEQSSVLQMPAFGKRFLLSTLFTFGLYPLVHGLPSYEKKRTYTYQTYGFCPFCGKTYNAGVPAAIQNNQQHSPKVYRSLVDKKIFGICGGIAEYTGLSVTLVRIGMVIYGMMLGIPYLLLGALNIIPVNPAQIQQQQNYNGIL